MGRATHNFIEEVPSRLNGTSPDSGPFAAANLLPLGLIVFALMSRLCSFPRIWVPPSRDNDSRSS